MKELLLPGSFMCKTDLKDAYFGFHCQIKTPRDPDIYQVPKDRLQFTLILCLCFKLSSAPGIFTKLMKIPIS